MTILNDDYLKALNTKLSFYKDLLIMIESPRNEFQDAFVEASIDFAFPGDKLNEEFVERLKLEIIISTQEIIQYKAFDDKTKASIVSRKLPQYQEMEEDIKDFKFQLVLQNILVKQDLPIVSFLEGIFPGAADDIKAKRIEIIKKELKHGKRY